MSRRLQTRRAAYTLIELMIASASSAILMGGLASALYISSRALLPDATATDERNRCALALAQMEGDLRLALNFSERTTRAVTFTVPDRNGDSQVDTIRYSWTGTAGHPLLYQYNANAAVSIATNVQQFNVSALTRTIPADVLPTPPASVQYVSFNEAKATSAVTSLTIPMPSGGSAGNLLIAAVAVEDVFGTLGTPPSGWALLNRTEYDSKIGLALWWKIATASEPANYQFTWNDGRRAYGWIMRFSGADPVEPDFLVNSATLAPATCLATTTTVNNAMVLRIAAIDDDDFTAGPGNHTLITLDEADQVAGGAAYRMAPVAGTTAAATFTFSGGSDEFITYTIVINPDDGI